MRTETRGCRLHASRTCVAVARPSGSVGETVRDARRRGGITVAVAVAVLAAGCASHTVRVVDMTPPEQLLDLPEDMLLDVGISVFDSNVPVAFDDQVARNIAPEVRRAEANFMPYVAKNLLQSTGNWGAVRVIPNPTHAVDVTVNGVIVHSDGERMIVEVEVHDARGVVWFATSYEALASKYAYDDTIPRDIDPFQSVYRRLADDMLAYLKTLNPDEVRRIRTTAEMKFAADMSPDAFADYLVQTSPGVFEIRRLPAENDPTLERVRKVREREYLFIDTLDEYFDNFHARMYPTYQGWRSATYVDAIAYRNQREKVRRKAIAGVVGITAGLVGQTQDRALTRYGGAVSVIGGATLAIGAIRDLEKARSHANELQELGVSAEAEISPHTIELENRTFSLQGTVEAQYKELRRILRTLYYRELGLPPPDPEVAKAVASAEENLKNAVRPTATHESP
ncbi:MAG: hypothetical protein F4029_12580 [Gammaproteobacteria bacterium]|nr:hypothetical protein [Gammaproteobacteria bacterium]MYF28938.1 hypothetical protein [Gammaproteobacteria bacterium]MYK47051.1 hypothetical protein [Gammaproteobacteria bacterium]